MKNIFENVQPQDLAAEIDRRIRLLAVKNTAGVRAVRREFSVHLRHAATGYVLDLARELLMRHDRRWVAYELIASHKEAFGRLNETLVEEFGQGIDSWGAVDAFARTLSGPAWLWGQVSDEMVWRWAYSPDLWWRRAALVSTVALNIRSQGGMGDVERTLGVCCILVDDREDMVVKALSWALRELVVHDAWAVRDFLAEHRPELAARVMREVTNKLEIGLKNPPRSNPESRR